MKPLNDFAQPFLRVTLALVFLYFGFQQIYSPDDWTGFVPAFLTGTVITSANIVIVNGILELTLGTFLLIGLYTRLSALVLSFHLLGITFAIGFTPLGVRDFGLAAATFALFLHGGSLWSIDRLVAQRKISRSTTEGARST